MSFPLLGLHQPQEQAFSMDLQSDAVSKPIAVISCVALALLYVAILYAPTFLLRLPPPSSYTNFMIRRFLCAVVSTTLSLFITPFILPATGDSTPATKTRSIVCPDCDGNGAILCTQCEGGGVNLIDHYNGRFKAGGLCWLCRGKKDILCGSCNGAGFIGGFMSTFDD